MVELAHTNLSPTLGLFGLRDFLENFQRNIVDRKYFLSCRSVHRNQHKGKSEEKFLSCGINRETKGNFHPLLPHFFHFLCFFSVYPNTCLPILSTEFLCFSILCFFLYFTELLLHFYNLVIRISVTWMIILTANYSFMVLRGIPLSISDISMYHFFKKKNEFYGP